MIVFSCNQSRKFLGLAAMKSKVDYNKVFPYWTQDNQWGAVFELEWIFIKDLPYNLFKAIKVRMGDDIERPVTFSRNAQEIPFEEGKKTIEIIEKYYNTNTILEHFEYYDIRQENYEKMFPNSAVSIL